MFSPLPGSLNFQTPPYLQIYQGLVGKSEVSLVGPYPGSLKMFKCPFRFLNLLKTEPCYLFSIHGPESGIKGMSLRKKCLDTVFITGTNIKSGMKTCKDEGKGFMVLQAAEKMEMGMSPVIPGF